MNLTKQDFARMLSEVSRYSGKVWASCLTAKNYQRDVKALLDHILTLTQELETAKDALEQAEFDKATQA